MSPETAAQISIYRQKALEGTITPLEMKEAVILLRADRRNAAVSSEQAKRTRAKKEIKSAEDMLGELGL